MSKAHAASNAYQYVQSLSLTLSWSNRRTRSTTSGITNLHLGRTRKLSFLNLNVLITVDLNNTVSTIWSGDSANDVFDTLDVAASSEPVESDVSEDIDETDERHDVGDTSASRVGNSSLYRWEDCSATNAFFELANLFQLFPVRLRLTHDQNTGSTTSVTAKVLSTDSEESWVHWRLKEENGNQNTNCGVALG